MADLIRMGDDGTLQVPDEPIIPFIEGDGTGVDIWPAAKLVLDAAAAKHGHKVAWKEVLAGQKAFDETGELAARRDRRHLPLAPDRDQGPADHAGRRRHPLAQRGAAPDPRPLRVPAPGALVHRRALARRAPRAGRHGHLPGEHRGRLRRLRGAVGHAGGRAAGRVPAHRDGLAHPGALRHRDQADLAHGVQAPHPRRHRVRARPQAPLGDAGAQGQHPEVHRGRVPRVGLRARARGVRRRRRGLGRLRRRPRRQAPREGHHRRHHAAAGADPARRTSTSSPRPTSTATTCPMPWPPRLVASASPRGRTSTM